MYAKVRSAGALIPCHVTAERVPARVLEDALATPKPLGAAGGTPAPASGTATATAAPTAAAGNVGDVGAGAESEAVAVAAAATKALQSAGLSAVMPLHDSAASASAAPIAINATPGSRSSAGLGVAAGLGPKEPMELCLRLRLPPGFSDALTPGQAVTLYRRLSPTEIPPAEDAAAALWPALAPEFEQFAGKAAGVGAGAATHAAAEGAGERFTPQDMYECLGAGVIAV